MNEIEIRQRAQIKHDRVCSCDAKYLMSCPRMATAILEVGAESRNEWKELLDLLTELEQDLDGVADEMTMGQIELHRKVAWALQLAKDLHNRK